MIIGHVNVIIHDDREPVRICARMTTPCGESDLFGMTRIHLLDRNRQEHPAPSRFVGPDSFDAWNPRLLQFFPNCGRTKKTAVVGVVIWGNRWKIGQSGG